MDEEVITISLSARVGLNCGYPPTISRGTPWKFCLVFQNLFVGHCNQEQPQIYTYNDQWIICPNPPNIEI